MAAFACGVGRTGKLFAAEHFDVEPHIMCVANAISGGCAGLGAMITTPAVGRTMQKEGEYCSTYGWHPLSTDVTIASIRYILRHRRRPLASVNAMSDYFRDRLLRIEFEESARLNRAARLGHPRGGGVVNRM